MASVEDDTKFVNVNASLVRQAVGNDLDASLASYAREVLTRLDEMVKKTETRLALLEPRVEWKIGTGKDFLPIFIEFLNGREYHDSREDK